jgi:sRNA-binding regulator protein Hfq
VITLVTLEGECFTGEIAWIGRYEVAMRTRQGVEVIVFRHAIDDLREG